jgi:hypothetical protein
MPSARSRLAEPLEKACTSRSMPSWVIARIEPFPNCFSMVETARAIAFSLWDSADAAPLPRFFEWLAMISILRWIR